MTTIRDNVEAVHRLLADDLKITHLRAIIGFSMGAQQAFQWAVSYPDFADRIVATSGTAKTYGARHRAAGGTDRRAHRRPDVQRRRLHRAAEERARGVRHGLGRRGSTRRSGGGASCGRPTRRPARRSSSTWQRFRNFIPGADANDLILQARTWERHDVGTTPGFNGDVERRCARSRCRSSTCRRRRISTFPVGDARYEAQFMSTVSLCRFRRSGDIRPERAQVQRIRDFLNEKISKFLASS